MSVLNFKTLQEAIAKLEQMGPRTAIYFAEFPLDECFHGPLVDEMLGLDPKREKGYVVPKAFRERFRVEFGNYYREVTWEDIRKIQRDKLMAERIEPPY